MDKFFEQDDHTERCETGEYPATCAACYASQPAGFNTEGVNGFHPAAPHSAEVMSKACGFCKGPRWCLVYYVDGEKFFTLVCEDGCDDGPESEAHHA